ncbi:MAG: hypothetical protein ACI4VW_01980 [Acutalibacteraceae bacterium]
MNDKKKRNLIIVLCVAAVIIAVAAIAFAPFGRKATGESDSPKITDSSEVTPTADENAAENETVNISPDGSISFVVPASTDSVVNPNKNYTFYIDKSTFDAKESDDGTTTLTAKENGSVKMTVTPVRDMSYKECCRAAEKKHQKLNSSAALKIENTNSVYRSQTGDGDGDIITTVYCVDDNKGGCILIDCRVPVSATEYNKTIEIMLSMFKVL